MAQDPSNTILAGVLGLSLVTHLFHERSSLLLFGVNVSHSAGALVCWKLRDSCKLSLNYSFQSSIRHPSRRLGGEMQREVGEVVINQR